MFQKKSHLTPEEEDFIALLMADDEIPDSRTTQAASTPTPVLHTAPTRNSSIPKEPQQTQEKPVEDDIKPPAIADTSDEESLEVEYAPDDGLSIHHYYPGATSLPLQTLPFGQTPPSPLMDAIESVWQPLPHMETPQQQDDVLNVVHQSTLAIPAIDSVTQPHLAAAHAQLEKYSTVKDRLGALLEDYHCIALAVEGLSKLSQSVNVVRDFVPTDQDALLTRRDELNELIETYTSHISFLQGAQQIKTILDTITTISVSKPVAGQHQYARRRPSKSRASWAGPDTDPHDHTNTGSGSDSPSSERFSPLVTFTDWSTEFVTILKLSYLGILYCNKYQQIKSAPSASQLYAVQWKHGISTLSACFTRGLNDVYEAVMAHPMLTFACCHMYIRQHDDLISEGGSGSTPSAADNAAFIIQPFGLVSHDTLETQYPSVAAILDHIIALVRGSHVTAVIQRLTQLSQLVTSQDEQQNTLFDGISKLISSTIKPPDYSHILALPQYDPSAVTTGATPVVPPKESDVPTPHDNRSIQIFTKRPPVAPRFVVDYTDLLNTFPYFACAWGEPVIQTLRLYSTVTRSATYQLELFACHDLNNNPTVRPWLLSGAVLPEDEQPQIGNRAGLPDSTRRNPKTAAQEEEEHDRLLAHYKPHLQALILPLQFQNQGKDLLKELYTTYVSHRVSLGAQQFQEGVQYLTRDISIDYEPGYYLPPALVFSQLLALRRVSGSGSSSNTPSSPESSSPPRPETSKAEVCSQLFSANILRELYLPMNAFGIIDCHGGENNPLLSPSFHTGQLTIQRSNRPTVLGTKLSLSSWVFFMIRTFMDICELEILMLRHFFTIDPFPNESLAELTNTCVEPPHQLTSSDTTSPHHHSGVSPDGKENRPLYVTEPSVLVSELPATLTMQCTEALHHYSHCLTASFSNYITSLSTMQIIDDTNLPPTQPQSSHRKEPQHNRTKANSLGPSPSSPGTSLPSGISTIPLISSSVCLAALVNSLSILSSYRDQIQNTLRATGFYGFVLDDNTSADALLTKNFSTPSVLPLVIPYLTVMRLMQRLLPVIVKGFSAYFTRVTNVPRMLAITPPAKIAGWLKLYSICFPLLTHQETRGSTSLSLLPFLGIDSAMYQLIAMCMQILPPPERQGDTEPPKPSSLISFIKASTAPPPPTSSASTLHHPSSIPPVHGNHTYPSQNPEVSNLLGLFYFQSPLSEVIPAFVAICQCLGPQRMGITQPQWEPPITQWLHGCFPWLDSAGSPHTDLRASHQHQTQYVALSSICYPTHERLQTSSHWVSPPSTTPIPITTYAFPHALVLPAPFYLSTLSRMQWFFIPHLSPPTVESSPFTSFLTRMAGKSTNPLLNVLAPFIPIRHAYLISTLHSLLLFLYVLQSLEAPLLCTLCGSNDIPLHQSCNDHPVVDAHSASLSEQYMDLFDHSLNHDLQPDPREDVSLISSILHLLSPSPTTAGASPYTTPQRHTSSRSPKLAESQSAVQPSTSSSSSSSWASYLTSFTPFSGPKADANDTATRTPLPTLTSPSSSSGTKTKYRVYRSAFNSNLFTSIPSFPEGIHATTHLCLLYIFHHLYPAYLLTCGEDPSREAPLRVKDPELTSYLHDELLRLAQPYTVTQISPFHNNTVLTTNASHAFSGFTAGLHQPQDISQEAPHPTASLFSLRCYNALLLFIITLQEPILVMRLWNFFSAQCLVILQHWQNLLDTSDVAQPVHSLVQDAHSIGKWFHIITDSDDKIEPKDTTEGVDEK